VLGDSASVGSLTGTTYGHWPGELLPDITSVLEDIVSEETSIQIAVRGNNTALKYDLLQKLQEGLQTKQDLPENTAARTRENWGMLSKIAEIEKIDLKEVNLVSHVRNGAKWTDPIVREWVDKLVRVAAIPDYLFILLGSNDFCREIRSVDLWAKDIEKHLERLTSRLKGTKIYITNVPDFRQWRSIDVGLHVSHRITLDVNETLDLGVMGKNKVKLKKTVLFNERLNLNPVRKRLCKNLYMGEDIILKMVSLFNSSLNDLAEKFQGNNVRIIDLFPMDIDPEDLAVDGFHLNKEGQRKLSLHLREAL